jgi:hypothetical protein
MDARLDWLNNQINCMQADRRLTASDPALQYQPDAEDLVLLQMAAQLNSLRPGAVQPDRAFLAGLRSCVLSAVESGHSLPRKRPRSSRL